MQNAGTNNFSWSGLGTATLKTSFAGAVGGGFGGTFGLAIGSFGGGSISPYLGNAISGYAAGFGTSMLMGANVTEANQTGLTSAASSVAGGMGAKARLSNPKPPSGPTAAAEPSIPVKQPPGKMGVEISQTPSPKLNLNLPKEVNLNTGNGAPSVNMGKQGKHIIGHNNYISGRSILTADPHVLAQRAGTGTPVGIVPRGEAGFKERVNFGETIGDFAKNGVATPTSNGIITYGSDCKIHIYPAAP